MKLTDLNHLEVINNTDRLDGAGFALSEATAAGIGVLVQVEMGTFSEAGRIDNFFSYVSYGITGAQAGGLVLGGSIGASAYSLAIS
ncbi:hypothetical protein [Oxynema aestuarii]|uniref:Uncharacterized protein n=1 Tax=Oxynema aestuarii AP17 TaxID=2064643 RepID=A0A6H1U4V7_9CYAN|nr:hypothetical protein [Oxynema aestuarii]QIZ72659.1 hypothetical protein HCG48_20390 [Oxynema aestuarii AP17]RMH74667.1 MAG: hypothetical protein D6680_14045 [Cyanobacteria bacterium J007]